MESFPLLFMSLFAMCNPIGNVSIFLGLTSGRSHSEIRKVAIITTLAVLVICVVSMVFGEMLLDVFGISLPAFRTAGGILILLIGLKMLLFSHEDENQTGVRENSTERAASVAVVPMALPIMAGPGLISTVILHSHGNMASAEGIMVLSAAVLCLTAVVFIVLMSAPYLRRVLGEDGLVVLTKVMGLFLSAIGVQFIFTGIKTGFSL